ncbi:hypothetical protein [Streptomyces sp. cmx-4-9]|uniref:hypothetical protein n=1 Tax=Streptomyces sp. cmx-4-9 TaxID=2790941 RepID=UPI00397F61BC
MSDDPAPRPAAPRRQQPMADAETLVDMGVLEEQPQPPPDVPPEPPVEEQANLLALDAALAESGVTRRAADTEAVARLAKLDAATVAAITGWVKHKKKDPPVKASNRTGV